MMPGDLCGLESVSKLSFSSNTALLLRATEEFCSDREINVEDRPLSIIHQDVDIVALYRDSCHAKAGKLRQPHGGADSCKWSSVSARTSQPPANCNPCGCAEKRIVMLA